MNPSDITVWLNIALTAEPIAAAFVKAILALRKKYPSLTPADIAAMVNTITSSSEAAFDDVLTKIAADQAAHPAAKT